MGWIIAIICFVVIVIGGNFLVAQIPSEARARHAAENVGVENAHVVSRSPAFASLGGCKSDDVAKFTVAGTRNGRPVTVQVCAPIIGGYTIRS